MEGSLPRFFYTIDEIDRIEDSPGLYSVFCHCGDEQSLIDVGQSDNLASAVRNNGSRDYWHQKCPGTLLILVFYTYDMQESERKRFEREIRKRSGLPEGKE